MIDLQDYSSPLWATITPERKEELLRWWGASLHRTGDHQVYPITDYAYYTLPDVRFYEAALATLVKDLPKCKALHPAQFRQWCRSQIDKQAKRLIPDIEKPKRKGIKTIRPFEQDGAYCIPINDAQGNEHLWKIEPDWLGDVEERIWPVHIRHTSDRPYLAKKRAIICPRGRKQITMPAHHIYLWFKYPGISDGDIACSRARNGDYLDWTNDNIYVPAFDGLSLSEAEREFRIREAIEESSRKAVNFGSFTRPDYQWVRVDIDPQLIEEWERKLAEGKPGDRDILDCGTKAGGPEITECEPIRAFDPRRIWRTPSTA